MPNHHHRQIIKIGNTPNKSLVISKVAIPMKFIKVGKDMLDVILGIGT